jgi:hypothetical protein
MGDGGRELESYEHRLGLQPHSELRVDAGLEVPRELEHLIGCRPTPIDDRQRVLVRDRSPRTGQREAAAYAGRLDEPCGAQFDSIVPVLIRRLRGFTERHPLVVCLRRSRPAWSIRRQSPREVLAHDRVGEERAGADRVLVGLVPQHALRGSQREHRLPQVIHGHTVADAYMESPCQLRVGDRQAECTIAGRSAAELEFELDGDDHAFPSLLENRGAVAESELGGAQSQQFARQVVEKVDGKEA